MQTHHYLITFSVAFQSTFESGQLVNFVLNFVESFNAKISVFLIIIDNRHIFAHSYMVLSIPI